MKKLLIMVQACASGPYPELMKAQHETWDSIRVPGVKTIYYHGTPENEKTKTKLHRNIKTLWRYVLETPCSDDYNMMHWKFKLAIDHVWQWNWDFIFRTNASTYVNKQRILNFIQDKPTEKYYSGINCDNKFVSGTSALLSRDCIDIARKQFTSQPNAAEDVYLGLVLLSNGIKISDGVSRPHYNFNTNIITDGDCYRCKSHNDDRTKDIRAFKTLFNHFHAK